MKFTYTFIIRNICSCIILFHASNVMADDLFWQSPQNNVASVYSQKSYSGLNDFSFEMRSTQAADFKGIRYNQRTISLSQNLNQNSIISFNYADAREHQNIVLGYTNKNLSLSYLQSSGEDYAELSGEYAGVDPYLFHGGYKQKFEAKGFAVDFGFAKYGHLQYGQASIQASGLEQRSARYLEWSKSRVFTRLTRFTRDEQNIGNGIDIGFAFKNRSNAMLAFQALELDENRSMRRIRLQFEGKQSRQYWIDFSAHRNPLYEDNDDYRLMFNFKTFLGTRTLVNYQNDSRGSNSRSDQEAIEDENGSKASKSKGRGWKRAVFIGVGVAVAASLSSSGSSSQDNNMRSRSQNDAAFDVLNEVNPRSVSQNREFGGWVFINIDGSYASTVPVRGDATSVTLPDPNFAVPTGSKVTASYHTHAAFDPRFDNENFSTQDLESDRQGNVDGYLATPGGQFKYHDVITGDVTTLGVIATD